MTNQEGLRREVGGCGVAAAAVGVAWCQIRNLRLCLCQGGKAPQSSLALRSKVPNQSSCQNVTSNFLSTLP
jgi:hypothetical protein